MIAAIKNALNNSMQQYYCKSFVCASVVYFVYMILFLAFIYEVILSSCNKLYNIYHVMHIRCM